MPNTDVTELMFVFLRATTDFIPSCSDVLANIHPSVCPSGWLYDTVPDCIETNGHVATLFDILGETSF